MLQVLPEYTIRASITLQCDPDVKVLLTPLTAIALQQFKGDNLDYHRSPDGKVEEIKVQYGDYADMGARYSLVEIIGLVDGDKPFKIIKDTVDEYGMKTRVREDCWKRIPNQVKQELYDLVYNISELGEKEIESLGFIVYSPGVSWTNAEGVKSTKTTPRAARTGKKGSKPKPST